MKSIVVKLLAIVLPVALIVMLSNYFIDPANVFASERYIGGIADILTKGHNVDNLSNYDERLLQEAMIKRLPAAPDVMVLGSSRVMEIGSEFFPGKMTLNCGVSHGDVNDVLAIVGLADSLGRLPKEMIILLDYFMIQKGGTTEWESLYPYHHYMIQKCRKYDPGLPDEGGIDPYRKVTALFSFDYFKSSLSFAAKRKSKKYRDAGLQTPSESGRFADGSIAYSTEYKSPDVEKVATDARVSGLRFGVGEPDPQKVRLMNALLDFLHDRGIMVKFVMIPLHVEYYKAVEQHKGPVLQTYAGIFHSLSDKRNIPLMGGPDADSLGMPQASYYDMYHCSKAAIKKYLHVE
jgi:hypothetical protein